MGNSYSSWLVYPSGVVGGNYYDGYNDVYDSYGREEKSPFTGNSYSAWDVRSSGDVGNDYDFVTYSYGHLSDGLFQNSINYWWLRSPLINWGPDAHCVWSHGAIDYTLQVNDSYGRIQSPDTHWNNSLIFLNPSGKIDIEVKWVDDSYGVFIFALRAQVGMNLRIIPVHLVRSSVFVMVITFPTVVLSGYIFV